VQDQVDGEVCAQNALITLNLDVDVIFREAGQLGLQHEGLVDLIDIDRGAQMTCPQVASSPSPPRPKNWLN
jgi:hypothetical protein